MAQPPRRLANSPQAVPRRPAPHRSPGRKSRKLFGTLALLGLAAVSAYGGYLWRTSPDLHKYLRPIFQQTGVAEAFPHQSALNLMIIGRDRDYSDRTDQVLKTRARSDLLMMAHLDFDKKTISLLSIPRDTRAHIPGHGITKINAAHEFGGPRLSEQTVQQNLGIPTDKYIALDFEGFEQAIDILGGVDLTVDKKMDYDDNWGHLHIHLLPGFQHLTGKQAIGFVRFRHSDSDLVRTRRQQTLLAALKVKLKSPQILAQIGPLLETIDTHVDSDLTTEQKVALARFSHDTPHDQIQMATLPSIPVGNDVVTDWPTARPMIQNIFGVTPDTAVAEDLGTGLRHRHRHHRRVVRVADRL